MSYFSKKPKEGDEEYSTTYNGAVYLFSSKENKALFLANPEKYIPAYGGWCAYAMGKTGDKIAIDPETYKIINGKLYLFYNRFFNNTLEDWEENEDELKKKADTNWGKLISHEK